MMGSAGTAGNQRWVALALFLLAAAFRFWGLQWGAPTRIDLHPDEMEHVMSHALAISIDQPDPKFLNYPSFLIYLIAIANGLATRVGLVSETWQSYIVARSIVAAFGAATAPAAFWVVAEMGASTLGAALAGLWVALLPLHVWESHFAVTDVVMTFWIVAALALSLRLFSHGRWADYAWTGLAIGLGVASKYTAALVAVAPLAAAALSGRGERSTIAGLFALGVVALLACFAATPFSFLHFAQFRAAMASEYEHVHSLHYGFSLPAPGWQYHKYVYELFAGFPFSLGFALYLSAAAGTLWTLRHPRRERLIVVGFAALFFAILGRWTFTPLRYQMPVVVVGAMLAGVWQGEWLEDPSRRRRAAAVAAVAVTLGYTSLFTLSTTSRLRNDTRIEAARWLDTTMKPGERLLACGFSPYMAIPTDRRIVVTGVSEAWVDRLHERNDFDLVEITSLLYWRHQRHHHPAFEPAYQRLRRGETGFHLVRRFEGEFLNRELYRRLDPMFAGYFISPDLEFYARG